MLAKRRVAAQFILVHQGSERLYYVSLVVPFMYGDSGTLRKVGDILEIAFEHDNDKDEPIPWRAMFIEDNTIPHNDTHLAILRPRETNEELDSQNLIAHDSWSNTNTFTPVFLLLKKSEKTAKARLKSLLHMHPFFKPSVVVQEMTEDTD